MTAERGCTVHDILIVTVSLTTGFSIYFQIGFNSATITAIHAEGILTSDEVVVFSSISRLAMVVGGVLTILLMDRVGRKVMLMLSSVTAVLGWALVAGGSTAVVLYVGKILIGASAGIGSCSGRAYVTETSSCGLRGAFTSIGTLLEVAAILVVYTLGLVITWRYLALVPAVVVTVQLLVLVTFHESPRWLLMKGRKEEARKALDWLRGTEVNNNAEYDDLSRQLDKPSCFSFGLFTQSVYFKPVLLSMLLELVSYVSANVVLLTYLAVIFDNLGLEGDVTGPVVTAGVAEVVAWAVAFNLVDRVGRRPLLIVGLLASALASALIALAFYLRDETNPTSCTAVTWLGVSSVIAYLFIQTSCVQASAATVRVEILPTEVRGRIMGLAAMVQGVLVFALVQGFPYIARASYRHVGFWVLSGVEIIYCLLIVAFLPETKVKTLEEIMELFSTGQNQRIF